MKGYYINLDHRNDRRKHFEKNIIKKYSLFSKIKRMPAVFHNKYGVGCLLSHINCIKELLKNNDSYYAIFEDDFEILNEKNFNDFIIEFDKIKDKNWDVIVLTPLGKKKKENIFQNFNKIINTQTTTGYIIKHNYLSKLLNCYNTAYENLIKEQNVKKFSKYCTDQCWKALQFNDIWIYFNKIYGGQLTGFSDIEKKNINYNKYFLNQK